VASAISAHQRVIIVATTRPETMLGDVAVAVHPQDERYRHLIGQTVRLPLSERDIPIIGDDYVDPAFGTGCLKITPAHDFNDYAIGARHALPLINVFTPDAKLNENAPQRLRGLDRFVARERIVEELQAAGLVERIEPHKLMVPRGDRTGAVIEPYLTDQWYVRIAPLARRPSRRSNPVGYVSCRRIGTRLSISGCATSRTGASAVSCGGVIAFLPGMTIRARSTLPGPKPKRLRRHALVVAARWRLRQDEDVLDTWFSSGLWPFSTLGMARTHQRIGALLSHRRAGDRLRHHLFLGRPHADAGTEVHREMFRFAMSTSTD
jgi:valyl-tRNA synthetase